LKLVSTTIKGTNAYQDYLLLKLSRETFPFSLYATHLHNVSFI